MNLRKTILYAIVFMLFGFVSRAQAAPLAPGSGAALCGALTVADFQSVGLTKASPPSANVSDQGASAYCVFSGKSSATGGIELDVFYPPGGPGDAKATEETATGEMSATLKPVALAGADSARWAPDAVSGGPKFAVIIVRRSALVFVLGIPAGPTAQVQLLKLAETALKRF